MRDQDLLNEIINKARDQKFSGHSIAILSAASHCTPINPYRYFGNSLRQSWAYGYFDRLAHAGFLLRVKAPKGARGHQWYALNWEIIA